MTSQFIKHIPCDKCGSSDGNSIYTDNHQFCHVCNNYIDGDGSEGSTLKKTTPMRNFTNYDNLLSNSIPDRGITSSTCVAYGVKTDDTKHYYPYYDADNSLAGLKVRSCADKSFSIQGDWKATTLFGQNKFAKGGRNVTLHEGELDALAGFQMAGSKYPHVSVKNGASAALKDCKAAYEWLDSFESIIISFDGDEVGQKAANEVAELFGSKCKIIKHMEGFKDACDYLKYGKQAEYTSLWWNAEQWTPDGVIGAGSLIDALKQPLTKAPVSYPWEGLDKMLYGLRTSELVVLAAGSGLGKSTMVREITSHILNKTDDKIGLAFLEETPERTMRGLIGLEMGKKIHLPDAQYNPSEIDAVYDKLDLNNRVFLWDHFGSNDIENVLNRLRYFVKALDCKWLVLDHLSILVSDQAAGDERKNIDLVMTKLRMFVQEVDCGLLLVSHLKRPEGKSLEDGAATSLGMLRGSAAIGQLADAVIGAERNSQADDLRERNTTRVRVLKARYTGYTGPACSLEYDDRTGRLHEVFDVL